MRRATQLLAALVLATVATVATSPTALTRSAASQAPLDLHRIAEHIVHALEPVPDERVVLRSDPSTFPALESAARTALERAGARVDTWAGADVEGFERRLDGVDVYVWLPGASAITSAAQREALRRWVDRGGTRRELHFHWSEGTLKADGSAAPHTEAIDRQYAEALDIDHAGLRTRQDAAIARLRAAAVRVTTPAGTDLTFAIGDRPFSRQDGDGSRRRVARARVRVDRHIELPAGVIRVAPIEESVRGTLVLPRSGARYVFSRGIASDAQGTVRFRELGMGFNRALAAPGGLDLVPYYGYGAGVVRLSLGDNEEIGGQVRGDPVRWFFFTDATVTAGDHRIVNRGRLDE
ncbi:MAG TPA: hypothetical protein VE379_05475 [Vicinamibacterales bacterium]|nr:hypothetical protein [Vicinamibacterales bacterium]